MMTPTQFSAEVSFSTIVDDRFSAKVPNEDYAILRALKALHRGENTRHVALLDNTSCPSFPLSAFLNTCKVEIETLDNPKHELVSWNYSVGAGSAGGLDFSFFFDPDEEARTEKGELVPHLLTGALRFKYEGTDFLVYKVSWHRPHYQVSLFDIVFEDPIGLSTSANGEQALTSAGHSLISDVYRWAGALKDEMWVFQDGRWSKDKALWGAIRSASWDDIILEPEFLEGLRRDTKTFFENRQIYQELGVVWKRGLLLLGPPGNGKTESIKVLLKESGQAALYVKSFTTPDVSRKAFLYTSRRLTPVVYFCRVPNMEFVRSSIMLERMHLAYLSSKIWILLSPPMSDHSS